MVTKLDLVSATEIGRMLGVSRQRAVQLSRVPGFPEPAAEIAAGRIWRRADIQKWAKKVGRTIT